ncbi:MAG: LysE family transporter [Saprospiraceae bacterium]|nr:LysE family transporter [Saprospiraceae bacterium]MCB0543586.1 LysE family transporter [Saprospiraceae bacterium]MCB0575575.1 LysE family transporter [Saprospiraceae bacterium]MCB9306147.1 LysE family transporter [Lewinellaceae bacterium]MCB9354815.1 LysE family transporter [Lewinellaceae bacterium]
MEAVLKGMLAGLAYGLLLGPMFFVSLKVTLSQGWRNGVALVGGAFASDALLVAGSWWSAAWLAAIAQEDIFQSGFGIVSGLILMGFGISAVWPRRQQAFAQAAEQAPTRRRYSFLQGFLINMSNPSNWIFWLSLATVVRAEALPDSRRYTEIFLVATLTVVLATDLAKVLLAHKIGKKLKPGVPEMIVRIAGVILIAVSGWMLIKVMQKTF